MNNETQAFISEGMKRFKQASAIAIAFRKEVEEQLQSILHVRKNWGPFTPKQNSKSKSTVYWAEYPLINRRLDGDLKGNSASISIDISWFESENEYPFYAIWLIKNEQYYDEMSKFNWNQNFHFKKQKLRFYPNPEEFNLEKDFNNLIDEFVRFLNQIE